VNRFTNGRPKTKAAYVFYRTHSFAMFLKLTRLPTVSPPQEITRYPLQNVTQQPAITTNRMHLFIKHHVHNIIAGVTEPASSVPDRRTHERDCLLAPSTLLLAYHCVNYHAAVRRVWMGSFRSPPAQILYHQRAARFPCRRYIQAAWLCAMLLLYS